MHRLLRGDPHPHRMPASYTRLRDEVGCDVVETPAGTAVVAWRPSEQTWWVSPGLDAVQDHRLELLLGYLQTVPGPHRDRAWWSLICVADGWREGAPAPEPILSASRPGVLCFSALVGDAAGVLLPESHWVESRAYLPLRLESRTWRTPYRKRRRSAVYAGRDHGDPFNVIDGDGRNARRLVADVVRERGTVAAEIFLDAGMTRRTQARHRAILDIDGMVRTWDALFWKLISGSVVVSQASRWRTFFSDSFERWEHFVPVANDFHDLETALDWVWADDRRAAGIARSARARALAVYGRPAVDRRVQATLRDHLFSEPS